MVKKAKKIKKDSYKPHDRIEGFMEIVNDKFTMVMDQFKGVFERLDNLSMDMTETKREIREVKFHVLAQGDTKLDKKHFVDLDQRVRRLEKK